MKHKKNKVIFYLNLLTAGLTLTSCGILDTETDKALDIFETKVYIYAESCDKFTSKPDIYHGPSLNQMLEDLSLQKIELEKAQKKMSKKQMARFEEIRDCILSKQFKTLKKRIAVDSKIYQSNSEPSGIQGKTSNKQAEITEKSIGSFFEKERSTIKAAAKKASDDILSMVTSEEWIRAQKIYNSIKDRGFERGSTPNVSKFENTVVKGGDTSGLISGNIDVSFNPRQDTVRGKFSFLEFVEGNRKYAMGAYIRKNQILDDLFLAASEHTIREKKEDLLVGQAQLYANVVNKLAYSASIEETIASDEMQRPAVLGFAIGQDLDTFLDTALNRSDLINWQGGPMKDSFGPCIAFACMTKLYEKPMFVEFVFCPTLNENKPRMALFHWKVTFTPTAQGAFQKALNDASEACKKSLDASDRARLLESLGKFGLRQVTDEAVQKNNAEALEQGLKAMQGAFQAVANRGNGSAEVNDVDREFHKFIVNRSKGSQIYEEEGKTGSDFMKIRLRSKERGVRMTTISGPKKSFFIMSENHMKKP